MELNIRKPDGELIKVDNCRIITLNGRTAFVHYFNELFRVTDYNTGSLISSDFSEEQAIEQAIKIHPTGKWQEWDKVYGGANDDSMVGGVIHFCHCGNKNNFEVWTELEYNDGADDPAPGNYLVNVEFIRCLKCGEVL